MHSGRAFGQKTLRRCLFSKDFLRRGVLALLLGILALAQAPTRYMYFGKQPSEPLPVSAGPEEIGSASPANGQVEVSADSGERHGTCGESRCLSRGALRPANPSSVF